MNRNKQPLNENSADNYDNDDQQMLDSLMNTHSTVFNVNKYFGFIVIFIAVVILWSLFTTIDQTVDFKGQVVPQGGIAKIKHESGGQVIDIHVSNYQAVKKGDKLLTIDNQKILTSLKQNRSKLAVVENEIVYAVAYLQNNLKDVANKSQYNELSSYLNNITETISNSKQMAEASRVVTDEKDQVIQQLISKNKIEIASLQDEISVVSDQLTYLAEQRKIYTDLLKTNNVSKIRVLDYEIKYREVLRDLQKTKGEYESKVKETKELESKRIIEKEDGIKQKYEELVNLNKEKIDLVSNISQLESGLNNLNIVAPIDGVVQGLNIVKGVTVQPGEEVLSIIPSNAEIVFEAEASLEQKGKINPDSKAEVQFSGFNVLQFNRVKGHIINVSPYTFNDTEKQSDFFKVVVKLDADKVTSRTESYDIKPGMSGILYVSTGSQSLFAYLFGPVYGAFSHISAQN